MGFFDRRLFADGREWVCSRAFGRVLEVAIGTGLNLAHYPTGIDLTGLGFSAAMLEYGKRRAAEPGRTAQFREAGVQASGQIGGDGVASGSRCRRGASDG